MSRMLKALQSLEQREQQKVPIAPTPPPNAEPESLQTVEQLLGVINAELTTADASAWTAPAAVPVLEMWQSSDAIHVAETPLYHPPTSAPVGTAEVVVEETADFPGEEMAEVEIASQYRDLAADLAETWDLPAAMCWAGVNTGRGHEVVGLSLAAALHSLLRTRVLVIDGDFRDPAAACDGQSTPPRLAEVLSGYADCRELAMSTIYPGVDVLSACWNEHDDGPLQQRADFRRLVRVCKKAYRVVLVTTPSLDCPETPLLAAACDGAYMVVRLGHATPQSLRDATALLESRGAKLFGCVSLTDQ